MLSGIQVTEGGCTSSDTTEIMTGHVCKVCRRLPETRKLCWLAARIVSMGVQIAGLLARLSVLRLRGGVRRAG